MNSLNVILVTLTKLIDQLAIILPKLIIALVVWYLGKYALSFVSGALKKLDIKGKEDDASFVARMSVAINVIGRVILVLIILDYLGIGSSVVASIAQGITFAVSIALGIAFGKALEEDAKKIVSSIRKFTSK